MASATKAHSPIKWNEVLSSNQPMSHVPEEQKIAYIRDLHPFENKDREFLVTVTVKRLVIGGGTMHAKNAPAQLWLMGIPTSAAIKFALTLARPARGTNCFSLQGMRRVTQTSSSLVGWRNASSRSRAICSLPTIRSALFLIQSQICSRRRIYGM